MSKVQNIKMRKKQFLNLWILLYLQRSAIWYYDIPNTGPFFSKWLCLYVSVTNFLLLIDKTEEIEFSSCLMVESMVLIRVPQEYFPTLGPNSSSSIEDVFKFAQLYIILQFDQTKLVKINFFLIYFTQIAILRFYFCTIHF